MRAHCAKCHDDKTETSEVQAERTRYQRSRGDNLVALHGRRIQITVDRVLRARVNIMKNKAKGPADLPRDGDAAVLADGDSVRGDMLVQETVQGSVGLQRRGKFIVLCFSRSQTPSSKKGYAFSKWSTTVLVGWVL